MSQAGTTTATRDCPYCGEPIMAAARKCKHCGEFLDGSARQAHSTPLPPPAPVYMNAGGAAVAGQPALRHWGHFIHIVLSVVTAGLWVPVWLLLYVTRNKSVFY